MNPFTSLSSSASCDHTLLPYNSKNRTKHGGCMGRILRRILCINSIRSPPPEEDENGPPMACESAASGPGIVARLMGLEPLRSPVSKSFEPFRKPRSPDGGRYHRIIPTYQEVLEDENFFILSFESTDFARQSRSRSSKRKQGKCKKKGTSRRVSLPEREEENVGVLGVNSNTREKEREKKAKRDDNLAVIKLETEGNSQNSSPISVLDFIESAPSPSSAEDISRLKISKLRRTLCEELENCTIPKETTLFINRSGYGHIRPRNKVGAQKWFEPRELVEHEMVKSSWVHDEMSKNGRCHLHKIGKDLASQVLEQLLLEFVINFS